MSSSTMESYLYDYEKSMHEAMEAIFQIYQSPDAEEEAFEYIGTEFLGLMDARLDPPFEVICIYSSPMQKDSIMEDKEFEERMKLMYNSFRSICEGSVSCGVSKSIALLAPVCLWIAELFIFVFSDFNSVIHNLMMMDIRSFVDLILGHVSVCCSSSNDDDCSYRLLRPLEDLLLIWRTNDRVRSVLKSTFSSLSDEIRLRLSRVGLEVSELSGAVAAQLFLSRMSLSLQIESENTTMSDLEGMIKRWGVATLTGLRNLDLFSMLLEILLERQPYTSILDSESSDIGVSLRKVLYDVILVDYTFLDLVQSADNRSSVQLKNITLMRLIVYFEAVEFFREEGDHSKAISCENAFSTSRLSTQIGNLVPSGVGLNKCKRNGSSPKAFLMWFLELEHHGVRVFSHSTIKCAENLSLKLCKQALDRPVQDQAEGEHIDADDNSIMISIDKIGENEAENEEELHKMSNTFIAASKTGSIVNGKKKPKRSAATAAADLLDSSGGESLDKGKSNSSNDAEIYESEESKTESIYKLEG